MIKVKGMVYLVGSGPGDPGLLTVKGKECLEKAEVVIYDRLVNPALLNYANKNAELIYVGKSPDKHTLTQDEINFLLVEKAQTGKIVVRLKGGDPFVFGRGGEEAETLVSSNISFEIVPGITSAIAVPAYAGIPVTHRDFTSTIGIITGNEDPDKEETKIDWSKLTGFGTLIFLMGMANLPKIIDKLLIHGQPPETPIALIRWGTRSEQETITGNLTDILEKVNQTNFKNPAIIIMGEVVNLREKLNWFENKPLFGKSVLVTRARAQQSALAEQLEDLGAKVIEVPMIAIESPPEWEQVDRALTKLDIYQWIIFTSVNGVNQFINRLLATGRDIRSLKGPKIAAIGSKTSEALEKLALKVRYMPERYVAESFIEECVGLIKPGEKILLPRGDLARKMIPKALREMGCFVDEIIVYRTVKEQKSNQKLIKTLRNKEIDLITFTSSSTVQNFMELIPSGEKAELLEGVIIASIGPVTTKTAEELGLTVTITAETYTVDGLVEAVLRL